MAAPEGRRIAWTFAALLIAANVADYVFDLYSAFWRFDRVLNGTALLAMIFWLAVIPLHDIVREGRDGAFVLLLAALGIAIGALWEVAEWAFDAIVPGDFIKGKNDTRSTW